MTDLIKRRTLKGLAAAAGTAATGLTANALASTPVNGQKPTQLALNTKASEGHLAIHTRLSPRGNDVEAVFTNAGTETLNIETLTPHEVTTFRGRFNIAQLTRQTPLRLAPGENVSINLMQHGDSVNLNDMMRQGQSLTRALQASATAVSTSGVPIHISVNETRAVTWVAS